MQGEGSTLTGLLLLSIILSGVDGQCWEEAACLEERDNLVGEMRGLTSTGECQAACAKVKECQYFTYYDLTVVAGLSNTCYLYSTCSTYAGSCSGCRSGPSNCSLTCHPPPLQGGIWSCESNKTELRDFDKCFYSCATTLIPTTCLAGQWDVSPSHMTCPCKEPPPAYQLLSCDSGHDGNLTYPGGTTCLVKCNHSVKTKCFNGAWTKDLSSVSCPGTVSWPITSIFCLLLILLMLVTVACVLRGGFIQIKKVKIERF